MVYKIKVIELLSKLIEKLALLALPIYWLSFLTVRDRRLVVFSSTFGYSFAGSPKYAFIYMNSIESDMRAIWLSRDDRIVAQIRDWGYEAYSIYSLTGIYYALKAKTYVFDHYSKDISFWLSARTNKFNLWHGIPLKKGNKDNKFDIVRNPRNIYDKIRWTFRRLQNENYSYYYAVTSEYMKKLHTQAFAADHNRVFVCGYARNDILVDNDYLNDKENFYINDKDMYERILALKDEGQKIIIYMPTHRDSEEELFTVMDFGKVNSYFQGNKITMIVKAHVRSKIHSEMSQISYSNIINMEPREDLYPYLNLSDILVTDYSSVYFDYLLLDRPMIFFAYDLDTYVTESRELYYDYEEITPGPTVRTMDELIASIDGIISEGDKYQADRQKILDMMFDYKDARAAERLFQVIREVATGKQ